MIHCRANRRWHTLMGLYSPFLMANQGSNGGGGPFSSLGGLGCKKIALLCQRHFTPGSAASNTHSAMWASISLACAEGIRACWPTLQLCRGKLTGAHLHWMVQGCLVTVPLWAEAGVARAPPA